MHAEAMEFIKQAIPVGPPREGWIEARVLEFGSRDVNGTPRSLFNERVQYVGVDIEPGPGADIVADAATVNVGYYEFDIVICAEVAEHTPQWRRIIRNAHDHLKKDGLFIFTAATDPRTPHSAVNGDELGFWWSGERDPAVPEGPAVEYYQNVSPDELYEVLEGDGFFDIRITVLPRGDVQATAIA